MRTLGWRSPQRFSAAISPTSYGSCAENSCWPRGSPALEFLTSEHVYRTHATKFCACTKRLHLREAITGTSLGKPAEKTTTLCVTLHPTIVICTQWRDTQTAQRQTAPPVESGPCEGQAETCEGQGCKWSSEPRTTVGYEGRTWAVSRISAAVPMVFEMLHSSSLHTLSCACVSSDSLQCTVLHVMEPTVSHIKTGRADNCMRKQQLVHGKCSNLARNNTAICNLFGIYATDQAFAQAHVAAVTIDRDVQKPVPGRDAVRVPSAQRKIKECETSQIQINAEAIGIET